MDRSKSGRIPTHADIVNVDIDDEADADFEERAEEFEHRYNFRFEEPCVRRKDIDFESQCSQRVIL